MEAETGSSTDGVATGGTLKITLKALSNAHVQRSIFAVPVAPEEVLQRLYEDADDGICLLSPQYFRGVSLYAAGAARSEELKQGPAAP